MKILIIIGGVVVILVLAFGLVGFIVTSGDRLNEKFFTALRRGDVDSVKKLLTKKGITVKTKDIYNVLTPSPLAIAASQGNTEMARLLIDHNADVNATSGRPRLPVLMHAAAEGQAGMVKFLIDRGADINAVADNNDDGGHKSGTTALMKAAEKGDSQIVELLIEKGADVNAKNAWEFTTGRGVNIQQATSFAFMSKMDAEQTVNYLFEQVTKEYPAEEFFKPPLLLAIENGNSDIVELLIEKGADLTWVFEPKSAQDWTWPLAPGMNAIMYAAYRGEVKAIEFLISKGLDVNAGDNTKQTALMYAAHQGEAEAVRLLVSKGADMNVRDMENQNALWYAVYAGGVEAVKSLVNSGVAYDGSGRWVAVGADGTAIYSTDGGNNWSLATTTNTTNYLSDIAFEK